MSWSARQTEMLAAMGLRVWAPAAQAAPVPVPTAPAEEAREVQASPMPALPRKVAIAAPAVLQQAGPPTPPAASDAHPLVRDLGWTELRAAVAACTACGLSQSRQRTVFGVGHESAHWMIVGEAPGEQEDAQGEPFVGAAGKLLDRMLAAAQLSREAGAPSRQVFIANALKCRPPGNRNPEPGEMRCCAPFLQRQIALVRPKVLLAMGRFAVMQTLGSEEPIGRLRGRVHRAAGVPVVVTFHPSYLLRQPTEKAKAWEDLCLAASVARS